MIATHRLPVVHFAALAAGAGYPSTIRLLKKAEFSKRLLQLRALLDHGDEYVRRGYEQLIEVHRHAPDAVSEVMLYPHVGAWATRCLQLISNSADRAAGLDLAYFGAVVAAAAIRANVELTAAVPVRDGIVAVPSVGCALVGDRTLNGMAIVRCRANGTQIEAAGRTIAMPTDPRTDADGWRGVRTIRTSQDGHVLEVLLDDLDPYRNRDGLRVAPRLAWPEVVDWQRAFDAAWKILVARHTGRAMAMAAGLTTIVPLIHRGGYRGLSATATDAFGAMAMSSPDDPTRLAETLVHEFQHAKLGALLGLVQLYDPGGDERYYAPWRDDPRPLGGLLQGVYAYLGVTDFWGRQLRTSACSYKAITEFEFALWRQQTWRALESVQASGRLTKLGIDFTAGLRAALTRWQRVQVEDGAEAFAEDAATDHTLLWRLRHGRPDGAAVDRLARAILTGSRPCVVAVPATTVVPGGPSAPVARADLRLRRIRARHDLTSVGDADLLAGSCGTSADIACVMGEYADAARGYRFRVIAEPDDVESWAGLSLVLRYVEPGPAADLLVTRPEVVFAVHRRMRELADGVPDPVELASWLADLFAN